MSPRKGRVAPSLRKIMVVGLGLLTGLGITTMSQACFPGCEDVEPLKLLAGSFERGDFWGDITPHGTEDEVDLYLDMDQRLLTVEFDSPRGEIVEVWELGRIERW